MCLQSTTARIALAEEGRGVSQPRRVPAEIRSVAFPVSVRGYDRRAVDAYVTRVNRVIAELEATRSPQSAVKRALERTEEERSGILEQAREAAEEITDSSAARSGGDDRQGEGGSGGYRRQRQRRSGSHESRGRRARREGKNRGGEDSRPLAHGGGRQLRRAQEEIAGLRKEAEAWMHELRIDTKPSGASGASCSTISATSRRDSRRQPRTLVPERAPATVPLCDQ